MYATLHGAFGTWPTESDEAFTISSASKDVRPSALNETFDFESENAIEPGRPVFTVKAENQPSGRVFIPPFFVPPGTARSTGVARPAVIHDQEHLQDVPKIVQRSDERVKTRAAHRSSTVVPPSYQGPALPLSAEPQDYEPDSTRSFEQRHTETTVQEITTRPPSPISTPEITRERAELWSPEARTAFHEIVTAEGYVNRSN